MTVEENLLVRLHLQAGRGDRARSLKRCTACFRPDGAAAEKAGSMSGGQQQMVAGRARALRQSRSCWLWIAVVGLAPVVVSYRLFEVLQTIRKNRPHPCFIIEQNVQQVLETGRPRLRHGERPDRPHGERAGAPSQPAPPGALPGGLTAPEGWEPSSPSQPGRLFLDIPTPYVRFSDRSSFHG